MGGDDFKGEYDAFGDVVSAADGIFGSEALRSHDSVKHKVTANGLLLEFYCQGCGEPKQLMIEFAELIAMRYGINPIRAFLGYEGVVGSPTDWKFVGEEDSWRPELKCPKCQFWVPLRIARTEPERHLSAARARGFLSAQAEQKISAIASGAAQQLKGMAQTQGMGRR